MSEIVWKDPPPTIRQPGQHGRWISVLTPLMERPGAWAMVEEKRTANAAAVGVQNLRRGMIRRPEGRWEFLSRGCEIYARYLGPENGS